MLDHYMLTAELFDREIARLLRLQCTDTSSPFFGVIPDTSKGFTEPAEGCGCAAKLITAYYLPESAYYKDTALLERAVKALDFSLGKVHPDGSIDLMETNFHDSTYNGFAMHNLGPAALVMQRDNEHTPLEEILFDKCLEFVKASARAMINLGFHTPNHRWVVSAALAFCYKLLGDEACLEHINKFLAEGIDCDENGEYTERSAGIYNIICNRSLMMIADILELPELFDHVTRNLYMSRMYCEPDGTVNTLNSTRQDMGKAPDFREYYNNYLFCALYTKNCEFAYIADSMLKKTLGQFAYLQESPYIPQFSLLLLHPKWRELFGTIESKPLPESYEKHFYNSGTVRIRKGYAALTLIKERPLFCNLQVGSHRLGLRFAGAFFGRGQFMAQKIDPQSNGYLLSMSVSADYKRPFDTPPNTSDWNKMDHSKRKNAAVQKLDISFFISLEDNRLTIKSRTSGCENVPLKLELILEPEGLVETEALSLFARKGDYLCLNSGTVSYTYPDGEKFVINGAFGAHNYGRNMRNSLFGEENSLTLACTAFSPAENEITVEF